MDLKKNDYRVLVQEDEDSLTTTGTSSSNKSTLRHNSSNNNSSVLCPSVVNSPISAILAYCGSSILMTVTNKYVLSGYDFNMNFLLLFIQSTVCIVMLWFFKFFRLINYREYNNDEAKKWYPICLLLVGMIYTGSKSLQYLSIPVYTIFKNLTIILIAYGEMLWFGGTVTTKMLFSFFLMILSSLIAAWSDISYTMTSTTILSPKPLVPTPEKLDSAPRTSSSDLSSLPSYISNHDMSTLNAGYIWMMMNCFASAAFVLTMRKRIKLTGFKDFDTVFYNNLLSLPILTIMSFLCEDWSLVNLELNFPSEARYSLLIAIIFSGISAFAISYGSAWCVRVTSSTTYSMVGALNKLPVAISGMIFFGDPVTLGNISAVFFGFIAGIVYSYAKTKQQSSKFKLASSSGGISNGGSSNILPMSTREASPTKT